MQGGGVIPTLPSAMRALERGTPVGWVRARARHAGRTYLAPRHAPCPGNACLLLHDGAQAFPAMLEAISSARRYVRVETYMFLDDEVGRLFSRALAEAAWRGVEVRVLYDALGSWGTPRSFFQGMRRAGVTVRAFRPLRPTGLSRWIHRDHRKLLIVDGEVAFIGGINLAAHWAPAGVGDGWRDDVLRVEGPAARRLERRFASIWRLMHFRRRGTASRTGRGLPAVRGEVSLCVLSSRRSIHRAYLRAIAAARRRIYVTAAYFVPDRRMAQALAAAARRGVEVALILNRRSDHPFLQRASRIFYGALLKAGVRIYEWQDGVLHSKTAVVDGAWGTVGSFNLEQMSLSLNHEANVVFVDRRLAARMEEAFCRDRVRSRPVALGEWRRRSLWQRLLERISLAVQSVF